MPGIILSSLSLSYFYGNYVIWHSKHNSYLQLIELTMKLLYDESGIIIRNIQYED